MDTKLSKHQAIEQFGGVRALADSLGITVQAVYQWKDSLPRSISDRIELALIKKNTSSEVDDGNRQS